MGGMGGIWGVWGYMGGMGVYGGIWGGIQGGVGYGGEKIFLLFYSFGEDIIDVNIAICSAVIELIVS